MWLLLRIRIVLRLTLISKWLPPEESNSVEQFLRIFGETLRNDELLHIDLREEVPIEIWVKVLCWLVESIMHINCYKLFIVIEWTFSWIWIIHDDVKHQLNRWLIMNTNGLLFISADPDSSRGSASEDQGLAFMWQKQHHPCFTAMAFWLCETGLWAKLYWQCWKVWD